MSDPTRSFPPPGPNGEDTRTGQGVSPDPDATLSRPGTATAPSPGSPDGAPPETLSVSGRPLSPAGAAPVPGPDDPAAPPGYVVERELGRGAMGIVYLARQTALNRPVALKMILANGPAPAANLVRFLAEAEAAAAVDHPHVVRVYDFGQHAGRPFLAMEYLSGGTLAARLESGPVPPREAAGLVEKVARGVAAAHALGIVHRDLKPGNVLLGERGEPKVADFGLAKRGTGGDLTHTQAVMGTPAYMAPEQAGGKAKFVTPAADVWALGVILYECLTGHKPFDGPDVWAILQAVRAADPVPPRRRVPAVPRDLELVCLKCLAMNPTERYAAAGELADDLARFGAGESVSVRPPGPAEQAARWVRRKPTLAAAYALGVLAVLLGSLGGLAGWQWRAAKRARDEVESQRSVAEAARDGEVRARQAAEAARDELATEREKLAAVEYGRTIEVAFQEWREHNAAGAAALLAGTRANLRGWEYNYVRRLCNSHLVTLRGHTGRVTSVAYSPDGNRVVTGSEDHTARVWDPATGTTVATLKGHASSVNSVAFSPDGRRVVTGSDDRTARVWDAATGAEVAALKGHTGGVYSAGYSPDGRRIVTGSEDRTVRVWDPVTGAEMAVLKGHTEGVFAAAFSPDGRWIVTGSEDGTARVWDSTPIAREFQK